jgi:nucleoside-diphosphate-sugar epimerase
MTSTHAVFAAAVRLGLGRVVWASSETTLGLPFDTPPDYAPVDEEHELRPESSYALSKVLAEEMARQFSRWSGIPFVGLRSAGDKSWSTYGAERAQTVARVANATAEETAQTGGSATVRNPEQPPEL